MNIRKTVIIILIFAVLFAGVGCSMEESPSRSLKSQETQTNPPKEEPPRIEEVSITAVGDIMMHSPQFKSAYVGGEQEYDFYPVFGPIEDYIQEGNIAIGNLETTFAGKSQGYSGYPMFNSPEQLAEALKQTGFDIITTANNHSLDRRSNGLKRTLDVLDANGLDHAGTYRSPEEQDALLIKNVNDVKIGFMAYTYGTNGIPIPKEEPYLVNLIDKKQMEEDIQKAKDEDVDIIVTSVHFGNEYQRQENDEQRELVDFLLEQGVDVVLGSHPHVIQPMEIRNVTTIDGEEKEAFVIYSLGNFVSNQRDRYKDSGLILNISFEKNFKTQETTLEKVEYTPTWVDKSYANGKVYYHVLPVEEALEDYEAGNNEMINRKDYTALQRTWKDTTEHLEQENAKMVIKSIQ